MPEKSERFSRLAYSRRAALLAEDLLEWAEIYDRDVHWTGGVGARASRIPMLTERVVQLQEMGIQLQRIAIQLQALR